MLTLVLGGARSGKSAFAEQLASAHGPAVLYLATARPGDPETDARIRAHQARRPPTWHTVETVRDPALGLVAGQRWDAVLLDSVTLWVSNLCLESFVANYDLDQDFQRRSEYSARQGLTRLLELQAGRQEELIAVSDEVGLSVVPENALGRAFRDVLGAVNQELAERADRAALVVAGLPLWLKGAA